MDEMTWNEIAVNSREAAQLSKQHHPRSCVSRAYYAAYSLVNQRLLPYEAPAAGFEGHAHAGISGLIRRYLFKKDQKRCAELRSTMHRLYLARLDADYRPSRTVDRSIALSALRDANVVFRMFGDSHV
jgi:uncharacterized protein (UPF0332 family)